MSEVKKYSGYGYHGGGRKKTGVKRVFLSVSCQPDECEKIKKLAKEAGMTTSKFVLSKIFGEKCTKSMLKTTAK